MKGVILAGGSGTRLLPNTKVTNKHLLPVYNKPMIYYAIETLLRAGIHDILILPGKDHAGAFAQLLGSGTEFNANFTYRVQESAAGLAYAVGLAEPFVGNDNFMVVFGDNIILDNLTEDVSTFKSGAKIFLKKVPDPSRHGIAELQGNRVISIVEKPTNPVSDWAAIGVYIYDAKAFEYIKELKPSPRGELEITDLNNKYIDQGQMQASFIKESWFDAGTHESLVEAAAAIRDMQRPVEKIRSTTSHSPKIVAGVILQSSRPYLSDFIKTFRAQDYQNLEILFFDNNQNPNNEDEKFVRANFPGTKILRAKNQNGVSKAHNRMIDEAEKIGAEFYLTLSPETIMETNFVSELANTILRDPRYGVAGGKIKQWHLFDKASYGGAGRTNFIESTGLLITREHRFINRGEGEIDHGQYDEPSEIFGASGTAALYRISALKQIAFINENGRHEYFDELMLKYKEDVDLSYRLQLFGNRAIYNPNAIAYHNCTTHDFGRGALATIKRRLKRNRRYKEWSFINHHIILSKYLGGGLSSPILYSTFWYEAKSLLYLLVLEPYLIPQLFRLIKLNRQIAQRKNQLKRFSPDYTHIERWMV